MQVLKFTLCYPPGECHPDALLDPPPDDEELSGNYELYEFQIAAQVPAVGSVWDFPELGGRWVVARVESYAPTAEHAIKGVHVLVCTHDGVPVDRTESQGYCLLGLRLDGDALLEREPGLVDWWIGSALSLPKPSDGQPVYLFEPVDARTAGGYDLVAVVQTQGAIVRA